MRRTQSAGEQHPAAGIAIAWLQSRRKGKGRQNNESPPRFADAAPEDSGGGATASLTPPSAPEDGSVKPSSYPPAPRLGATQTKTFAKVQALPQTDSQQKAPTAQKKVRRGIGPDWAPEKSGYESSESDVSEGNPSRSRADGAEATASGGEDPGPSTLPDPTTARDRTNFATVAMAAGRQPAVARSSEKTGTTSGSTSYGVSRRRAKESGGDRVRLDVSTSTEVTDEMVAPENDGKLSSSFHRGQTLVCKLYLLSSSISSPALDSSVTGYAHLLPRHASQLQNKVASLRHASRLAKRITNFANLVLALNISFSVFRKICVRNSEQPDVGIIGGLKRLIWTMFS